MATSAIGAASNAVRPNVLGICFKETKYEFLKNLRLPMYSVSTIVFPVMFYVLFGLIMGRQNIGNISTTTYLIAAYGTFGVMGASLFGTAAGLASERGFGWLQVKKATPMPPFAYFLPR
jgi:ABC-2 type transport system permease protein